jgi:hypothetical protein
MIWLVFTSTYVQNVDVCGVNSACGKVYLIKYMINGISDLLQYVRNGVSITDFLQH